MEDKNIIYALKDPRTEEYKYVGKTVNGIIRVKSHMGYSHNPLVSEWVTELKQENYEPTIQILENVNDWTQLVDKEKYWVGKLLNDGEDLLNVIIRESAIKNEFSYNKKMKVQIKEQRNLLEKKLNKIILSFGDLDDVGKLIRNRRKELNINQKTLSQISGISANNILNIEKGKANPTIQTIKKLFDTLGFEIFINLK